MCPPHLAAQQRQKKSMHALTGTYTRDLQYLSLGVHSATALIAQSDRAMGALMWLLLHSGILTHASESMGR